MLSWGRRSLAESTGVAGLAAGAACAVTVCSQVEVMVADGLTVARVGMVSL